jgi:hypothetical protein
MLYRMVDLDAELDDGKRIAVHGRRVEKTTGFDNNAAVRRDVGNSSTPEDAKSRRVLFMCRDPCTAKEPQSEKGV